MFKLTNIPQENSDIDKIYTTLNKKNILTTNKNGSVTITNQNNELIKELKNHKGSIMEICFAPITFPSYFISVGYDRRLNLYNLNEIQDKPLFFYQEESLDYGFFNHVSFLKSNKNTLIFSASTSNGYLFIFSSENNFVPEKKQIFNSAIRSFKCLNNGAIVVSAKEEKSRVYFDTYFSGFIEFGDDIKNDIKKNFFASYLSQDLESDDNFIEVKDRLLTIWSFNNDEKELKQIFSNEFNFDIVNANWNFGGLSANVCLFNKESGNFEFSRLCKDLNKEGVWNVKVLDMVNN